MTLRKNYNNVKVDVMEFRAPSIAAIRNKEATEYFTKNLSNPESGRRILSPIMDELGSAIDSFPYWHPILTAPKTQSLRQAIWISDLKIYTACEHTKEFVRGFITCPYDESEADQLVRNIDQIPQLHAYRLDESLFTDNAYPVIVVANEVKLEADGTIRSRDAIRWFTQQAVQLAETAQIAETWWNIRSLILGQPHGARSSLLVNQHSGAHMRKILEALNNSGMYGEIKEYSLEMLSKKKRDKINETLLRAALKARDKKTDQFTFELRGETCKATICDTWDDGVELSIRVEIGDFDLSARGYYEAKTESLTYTDPTGKRALAEKFL